MMYRWQIKTTLGVCVSAVGLDNITMHSGRQHTSMYTTYTVDHFMAKQVLLFVRYLICCSSQKQIFLSAYFFLMNNSISSGRAMTLRLYWRMAYPICFTIVGSFTALWQATSAVIFMQVYSTDIILLTLTLLVQLPPPPQPHPLLI